METLKDLFSHHIEELYSIECQQLNIMPVMITFAKKPEYKEKMEAHLKETMVHKKRIKTICDDLGIEPDEDSSKVMYEMVSEIGNLIHDNLHDGVQDSALLTQSERIEHYEIASYDSALKSAKKLGNKEYVELLSTTLDEEYEAEEDLSAINVSGEHQNHLKKVK